MATSICEAASLLMVWHMRVWHISACDYIRLATIIVTISSGGLLVAEHPHPRMQNGGLHCSSPISSCTAPHLIMPTWLTTVQPEQDVTGDNDCRSCITHSYMWWCLICTLGQIAEIAQTDFLTCDVIYFKYFCMLGLHRLLPFSTQNWQRFWVYLCDISCLIQSCSCNHSSKNSCSNFCLLPV